MKQLLSLLLLIFIQQSLSAQVYQYELDLTDVRMDRLIVKVNTPPVEVSSIHFHFPKIIPGTYTEYDFGRFVHHVNAFDAAGNGLSVIQEDVNTWKITPANKLHHITYEIDDTFDATGGRSVSGMSGTNIEAGKNFLLNGHGVYGYLEGMEFIPFKVQVKKPTGMVHQSAYTTLETEGDTDWFWAENYHQLVDMPVMYCVPDTTIIKVDDTEVLIAVYSPNGLIQTSSLREPFKRLLQSQRDYLDGNLPVERYAFLMYFMGEQLPIGTGALEHNYSSVYCLPEMPEEQIRPFLLDISSHEFFHIITPLSVHSEEIHFFDFAEPDMSRHLWMYEGITEYFSHHNQVQSGMITPQEFLNRMGTKVVNSKRSYQDDLSFTKMSKKILGKYEHEYGNVYEKGALLAMCLDIELIESTNGEYSLVALMEDLSKKYGKDKPFKDKKLFKAIAEMTNSQVADYLKTYVKKGVPLPYDEYFNKMGIAYQPPRDTLVYSLGNVQLTFDTVTHRLVVTNTYGLNEMGRAMDYRVGDQFVSVLGKKVPAQGIREFFGEVMSNMQEGEKFLVEVLRDNAAGEPETITLSATTKKAVRMHPPQIQLMKGAEEKQLALREKWLGKNG
jgi:predicted metalloprotease with PDZ domain